MNKVVEIIQKRLLAAVVACVCMCGCSDGTEWNKGFGGVEVVFLLMPATRYEHRYAMMEEA